MIQLKILSGKTAGALWTARRFPVQIGRAGSADLRLEENGVWENHATLELKRRDGFFLEAHPPATTSVNGKPIERAALRNGDEIEIGSVKLQFWLAEARQRGLRIREISFWAIISLVCLGQIGLIYWLVH
ncbi:MAG TPA: FHA domain-containing protein [Verrucomicrobiae bacterium]|nr:FHA domain-containing protein [Verrucomicrobiae bacterium]